MPIVVHVQAVNGGTSNRGDANDLCAIAAPNKVIGPVILARIKEGLDDLGFGVDASGEVVPATIATDTSKGKIRGIVAAVKGLGEDVVERKNGCAACFGRVAIFAQEVRSFADKLAGGTLNGHGAWQIQR
jgi:hypothetical protein